MKKKLFIFGAIALVIVLLSLFLMWVVMRANTKPVALTPESVVSEISTPAPVRKRSLARPTSTEKKTSPKRARSLPSFSKRTARNYVCSVDIKSDVEIIPDGVYSGYFGYNKAGERVAASKMNMSDFMKGVVGRQVSIYPMDTNGFEGYSWNEGQMDLSELYSPEMAAFAQNMPTTGLKIIKKESPVSQILLGELFGKIDLNKMEKKYVGFMKKMMAIQNQGSSEFEIGIEKIDIEMIGCEKIKDLSIFELPEDVLFQTMEEKLKSMKSLYDY